MQLFTKSRPEMKMLDSLCRFLVDLLATNGEIMVFKSVYGKSLFKDAWLFISSLNLVLNATVAISY